EKNSKELSFHFRQYLILDFMKNGSRCLSRWHHHHVVDVNMWRSGYDKQDTFSNIGCNQIFITLVYFIGSRLVAMKAYQRKLCFHGTGTNLGYLHMIW